MISKCMFLSTAGPVLASGVLSFIKGNCVHVDLSPTAIHILNGWVDNGNKSFEHKI